jgi:Flp pilus assembly protein TadD
MTQTPPGGTPPTDTTGIELLLRDERVRAQLVELISAELAEREQPSAWSRIQPYLAGMASALVTILAFFLPSLQEQWDRWQSRQVITRYVEMGRSFEQEGRYRLAEESFAKAFELSENRRLDIEEMRLEARVDQVNADPEWGKKSQSLRESDFLYLLHLRDGPDQARARAATLGSYGVFLAGEGRLREAGDALREATRLDPGNAVTLANLGSVLTDLGEAAPAESLYRRALALDSTSTAARFNLGLLLSQSNRGREAEAQFRAAARLAPGDRATLRQLAAQLEANGEPAEARAVRARAARLPKAEEEDAVRRATMRSTSDSSSE